MNKITKLAVLNAMGTTVYIMLVGAFMYYGSSVKIGKVNAFLGPVAFLLLFVLSAAITGYLILGKPAQWYVDGKKKEALQLLTYTIGIFFVITLACISLLLLFSP